MKDFIVKQNSSYSCATACVLSLIKYYGGDMSYEELNVILNASRYGTNAYDILNGVKSIGFVGRGIKLSFNDLISYEIVNPLIAHVIKNNMYHFVVIYKIDKKKKLFSVMDPSEGMVKVKFDVFEKMYLSTVLDIVLTGNVPNIKNDVALARKIFKVLKKYKILVFKVLFLSLLVITFTLFSSVLLKLLLELNNFKILCLIFVIVILLKNFCNYFLERYIILVQNNVGVLLLKDVIFHIFKVPIKYVKNKNTGDILDRIRDLEDVKNKLVDVCLNIFVNVLLLVFILIFLSLVNINLFLISILFTFVYFILSILYYKYFKRKIFEVKSVYAAYESFANDSISNYVSIKNLQVEDIYTTKFLNKYYCYLYKLKSSLVSLNVFELVKNVLSDLFLLVVIVFLVLLLNKAVIKLSDLFFVYSLILSIVDPVKNIFDKFSSIEEVKVSLKRVNDLLRVREEVCSLNKIDGQIVFENVKLNFIDNNSLINFSIKKGALFLLYGSSGVGKSSLLKIVTGESSNYKGNVFVGGVNIKDLDEGVLLNSASFVSQEEKLFNDTLENNIKLYRDVSDDFYEKILKVTLVDKIRNSKKFRNDFVIYEDGVNLSGGERQKIILARALIKDFNYLIIDEGLSEVNLEDEKIIINNIRKYFFDKTIIYVSHKKEINCLFKEKYFMKGGDNID